MSFRKLCFPYMNKSFVTPPPNKMTCDLKFFHNEVVVSMMFGETRTSEVYTIDEFVEISRTLQTIKMLLGTEHFNQVQAFLTGKCGSLIDLPEIILVNLVNYISIRDLLNLMETCKYLNQLLGKDELWRDIYTKHYPNCRDHHGLTFRTLFRMSYCTDKTTLTKSINIKSINAKIEVKDLEESTIVNDKLQHSTPCKDVNDGKRDELKFTKSQLQKRLRLLLEKAQNCDYDRDKGLPGDRTQKYALRYSRDPKKFEDIPWFRK